MSVRTLALLAIFQLACSDAPSTLEDAGSTAGASLRFDGEVVLPQRRSAAPILIFAPAGEIPRIAVATYSASATIAGDSASTELTLSLSAPSPPGARLSLRLPRDAEVTHLAAVSRSGERWRRAGAAVPADRLEIPVASVEHRFAPVLPAGTTVVRIAYTEPLAGRYRLALLGLPRLDAFRATVRTSTGTVDRREERWLPTHDLELSAGGAPAPVQGNLRPIESLMVLIDSSASASADWERRVATVRALIEALRRGAGPETWIHLSAFDQTAERLYQGELSGLTPEIWSRLSARGAFGATNLSRAFAQLGREHPFARALLVSDGVFTSGARDPTAMAATIKQLSAAGVKRFDVLAFGDVRDERLLAALAAASPGEPGAVIDGDLPLPEIARRLEREAPASGSAARPAKPRSSGPAFFLPFAGQPADQPPRTKPIRGPLHRGRFAEIAALEGARQREGLQQAQAWHEEEPFEPLPLLALGDSYAALNDIANAARAYGSLIDLYPTTPEVLQLAACRLETLRDEGAIRLSLDAFDRAVLIAPERPWSHRLFAWGLLKAHQEALALAVLDRAAKHLPFGPLQAVLRDDAAVIAAAWIKKEPENRAQVTQRLIPLGATVANQPSVTFSLYWSADVDVDLLVRGPKGGPLAATSAARFGPEVVTVRSKPRQRTYPYRVEAQIHGLGALGMTAGKLEVMEHDGRGGVWFAVRSFVLTSESGVVDLGSVDKPFGRDRGL